MSNHQTKPLRDIANALQRVLNLVRLQIGSMTTKKSNQELLFLRAETMLGKDASPLDFVNDELGCAESVSNIIRKVVPFVIITGTWTLNDFFYRSSKFERATEHSGRGTIIICATGTGNGKIRGHVGIMGDDGKIMSSSSYDGTWRYNYNITSWKKRWGKLGGFPIHYYTIL